jgi:hypothetical protein
MNLNRSCREVTRLVLESEERELSLADRLALQLHWRVCDACRKFNEQAKLMREAMSRWRGHRDGDDPPDRS